MRTKWWQRLLIDSIIFLSLAGLLDSFTVTSWPAAILAAIVLGLLNIFVKPILLFFSLPITFLTMGLFYFVINGLMISFTSFFVSGFQVDGFGAAMGVSLLLSLINSVLGMNE